MIELIPSPFKPGKAISSSQQQFYHLYKDGKIVDRTLYTKYGYTGDKNKSILVLNKRTIAEIKPSILDYCRKTCGSYPRYTMTEDIVVVNGETGKIIFDTNDSYCFDGAPYVVSDYIFKYKNSLYNNKGELIKTFEKDIKTHTTDNFYIVIETYGYTDIKCYVFDKFGKLINEYK